MKKLVLLLVALILLFSFSFVVSAADFPAAEVSLASNYDTVEIGEEVKVTLSFDNASDYPYGLAAFCSYLTYDSNVLRVKSTNVAVPRSSIRHNSMSGELRSIYTFASAQKKPGFNTDGAFYTVTFEAIGSGSTKVNVTFDAITVTDYESKELNYKVEFNSADVTIKVNGDDEPASSAPTSSKVESTNSSSKAPSNTESKTQSTNSKGSSSKAPTNSIGGANSNPTTPDKPQNQGFKDVADLGQDTVQDVFDESGEIIEQTESKAPAANNQAGDNAQTGKDEALIDNDDKTNNTWLVWVGVAVGVAALIAVVAIVLLKSKKK